MSKAPSFLTGLREGLPVFLGYYSISIAYGLIARSAGLSEIETITMSLIVFAGASQFMAVSMIAAGAGSLEIILSTLLVNLRHIIMSASIKERLSRSGVPLFLTAFGVTDETFSLCSLQKGKVSDRFFLGVELISYTGWFLGTVSGVFFGNFVPDFLQNALGSGLYAMFVALLIIGAGMKPRPLLIALVAAGVNLLLTFFRIPTGICLVAAIIVASLFAVLAGEAADE